jgi:hypothetical protein
VALDTAEPASAVDRATETPIRWSQQLWGLDWAAVLPWRFDDVVVEAGAFDDAVPFVEDHYAAIFRAGGADTRFITDAMTPAKVRFSRSMDVFLMRHHGATVGALMAHPVDWSSYYMRSVAILPAYRDRRVLTRLVEAMVEPLRAVGVERIEGEVSPGNLPMMRMLVGLGWLVSATVNSERWGTMVRLTKFLREDAETTFVRHFCGLHVPPRSAAGAAERTTFEQERRTS